MASFNGTAGADSFIGADGEGDTFRFAAAHLTADDTVVGGAGGTTDLIRITTSGLVAAASFANVSGIEAFLLYGGDTIVVVAESLFATAEGGTLTFRSDAGSDVVDGSLITNPAHGLVFFTGEAGNDAFIGGAGSDKVVIEGHGTRNLAMGAGNDSVLSAIAFLTAADTIDGGAGMDRLSFTDAGAVDAADLAGLTSIEEIELHGLGASSLTVSAALAAQAGGVLTVIGNNADGAVDASALGAALAVNYSAGRGVDSFIGGAGADTVSSITFELTGTLGAGDDSLVLLSALTNGMVFDGGAGFDEIVLTRGGTFVLGEGLTGFEEVVLERAANVTLATGSGLRLLGSDYNDRITLGGPGQTVFASWGNDIVTVTAASLLGSVISGGAHSIADTLVLSEGGSFNLRTPAVSGFERIQVQHTPGSPSNVMLADGELEVVLRGQTFLTTGLSGQQTVFGSRFNDSFLVRGANQVLDGGSGNDLFELSTAVLASGGIVLSGSAGDFDRIFLLGGGTADLFAGPSIALGIEVIEVAAATEIDLPAVPLLTISGSPDDDIFTMRAAGLMGTLGEGDDTLRVGAALIGDPLVAFADLFGGGGSDHLVLVPDIDLPSYVVPTRVREFEVLNLTLAPANRSYVIEGDSPWVVLTNQAGPLTIQGGDGDETFDVQGPLHDIRGGGGDDTIITYADPTNPGQVLDGEGGNDVIFFNRQGQPRLTATMPDGWSAEQLQLVGEFDLTTNPTSSMAVRDNFDPNFSGTDLVSNRIVLAGSGQSAQMFGGNDTLRAAAANVTMVGGHGDDIFEIYPEDQPFWSTPGQMIIDENLVYTDTLRLGRPVGNSGTLSIDFTQHTVETIDRIEILAGFTTVSLTLSDAMAQKADFGILDVRVALGQSFLATNISAAGLLAPHALWFGVYGGQFNGADTVNGGAGGDTMIGWAGDDSLSGGGGNDIMLGADNADTLNGGAGNDSLGGGAGDDRMVGGDGDDELRGDAGNDSLFGASGDDFLVGGAGNDSLDGGAGGGGIGDTVDYSSYSNNLSVNLQLTVGQTINGPNDVDTLFAVEHLLAGSGNDSLVGNSFGNILNGSNGADTLVGLAGADTLIGGGGADLFVGGTGGDRIELAAAAADRVRYVGVTDGTADIDTTQLVTNADLIAGFDGSTHLVSLWLTQLGMPTTNANPATAVKVLAANETIDLSAHAVFVLHPADTLGFSTSATDFGSFQGFADALNLDAGPLVNSDSATRKAFLVPNGDFVSPRQTGLYLWLDSDADAVVEATDEVRLLAVFDGVSTAAFTTANFELFL